jgi:hypothetical protein
MGTTNEITELERKTILGKLCRLRQFAIAKLTLLLSLPLVEILGLKHSEVEWTNGKSKTITIARRVDYMGIDGKFDFYITEYAPTNYRKIKLPRQAAEIIKWLERNDIANRKRWWRVYTQDYNGYVCVNKSGGIYQPNFLKIYFRALIRRTRKELKRSYP